jgi:hypothetical protein
MTPLFYVVFLCCIVATFGQACPSADAQQNPPYSPSCTSSSAPYCVSTSGNMQPTYNCVQCISNCDCPNNQYCSTNVQNGNFGKCLSFGPNGQSCRPLTNAQIANSSYPSSWKCAVTYTDSNNNLQIDQVGACVGGTCRTCDPGNSNAGLGLCAVGQGTNNARVCSYPGTLVTAESALWSEGLYYQNVDAVWWAIFFVFFLILIAIQVVHCIFVMKSAM